MQNRNLHWQKLFLNYLITIEWKNFENIIFAKKWENKQNFYAWIIIIVTLMSFLGFILSKNISNLTNIFNNHSEILIMIFSVLWFAIIGTIKEYKKLKNQHNQENDKFLKNFDIISENSNTINSLNNRIFEHFANLAKIDKNFTIIFINNKIIFQKKITKIPYFHNPQNSSKENMSRYINFYLEMKEIFYIVSKI